MLFCKYQTMHHIAPWTQQHHTPPMVSIPYHTHAHLTIQHLSIPHQHNTPCHIWLTTPYHTTHHTTPYSEQSSTTEHSPPLTDRLFPADWPHSSSNNKLIKVFRINTIKTNQRSRYHHHHQRSHEALFNNEQQCHHNDNHQHRTDIMEIRVKAL